MFSNFLSVKSFEFWLKVLENYLKSSVESFIESFEVDLF